MAHKKRDPDDPQPLDFDRDARIGTPGDHLKKPFLTPEEERGDNAEEQYYEEEESLSPEEVKKRKLEDSL